MMTNQEVWLFFKFAVQGWVAISIVWWFVWMLVVILLPIILAIKWWFQYGR